MRSTRSDVTLSPAVREGFAAAVRESLGLVFPPSRAPALDRGIASAAALLGEPDPAVLLGRLLDGDPAVREALIVELTVGETYLFRDDSHFDFVRDVAIPEAARVISGPGDRALTQMPSGPSSAAMYFTLASSAALTGPITL